MPDFDVTSPDGKTFRVSAPEGATQEQALAYAKRNLPKAAPEKSAMSGMIGDVGAAIGGSIETLGRDFSSAFPTPEERKADLSQGLAYGLSQEASRAGSAFKLIPDVAGVIASPITGLAHATIGRGMHALTPKVPQEETNAQIDTAMSGMGAGTRAPPKLAAPPVVEARKAGYVLSPEMITDEPGIVAGAASGMAGKIKTQQLASVKNQEVTNKLATKALGVPDGTTLTDKVFKDLRSDAGKDYAAVPKALPTTDPDAAFKAAVGSLGGRTSQAAQHFPQLFNNAEIKTLSETLGNMGPVSTDAALDLVRQLRFEANSNLKTPGAPDKHALGLAQREAANAMDDLIERRLSSIDPGLVDRYKKARQLIAKSYDVEGATDAAGNVNAAGLAKLAAKGRPLTDELLTIANAAESFPKAMQNPAKFGGVGDFSALDFFGSALAAAHGHPGIAAGILARPVVRGAVLSNRAQNRMAGLSPPGPSVAAPTIAAGSAADALDESPDPAKRALGAQ